MELDRNQLPQLGFVASLQLGPTLIAKLTQARNKEVERARTPVEPCCVAVATWGESPVMSVVMLKTVRLCSFVKV